MGEICGEVGLGRFGVGEGGRWLICEIGVIGGDGGARWVKYVVRWVWGDLGWIWGGMMIEVKLE